MPLVLGLYVPNAPNLIDPRVFGGAGAETVRVLQDLHLEERLRPGGVVVVSPHWLPRSGWQVDGSDRPKQVYDFTGFPPSLYQVNYRPPGDPRLARELALAASRVGLPVSVTDDWGLDHGAWAPLMNLLPGARVPVLPLSIARRPARDHLDLGRVLRDVLEADPLPRVLVATGSITHRLDRIRMDARGTWREGAAIEAEIAQLAVEGRVEELLSYPRDRWRTVAPEGELLPLFTLLGAVGEGAVGRIVSEGQVWQAAGMSVLQFAPGPARPVVPASGP
jgi:4,5-DOPA dioxygenase extradiol